MKISETTLWFLESDCVKEFGQEKGRAVFQQAEQIYQELLQRTDDRDSDAIRAHLQAKLFPPMAYYKALQGEGIPQDQALEYVRRETRKAANVKKEEMRQLAKMPFAYTVYRLGVKRHMKKNFPEEGWQTEWMQCDGKEIHFNLTRCLYWELSNAYGCPELCSVYCENDDISFSGLLPKIRFERTGTLGSGSSCCDFHFRKGSPHRRRD